jgi:HK97 family phage portal protein
MIKNKIFSFFFQETEKQQPEVVIKKADIIENSNIIGTSLVDGFRESEIDKKEYLKEIKGWSFACINAIAENIAMLDIRLYKQTKDKIIEIDDHPILDSLYKVNDYTTRFDHLWLTAAYLEAVGESPWFLDKDNNGKILGIYLIDPSRIKPVADKENKRFIGGYELTIENGKKEFIPYDKLIMLKVPNPSNPTRGIGTMYAGARTIDIDNQAEKWNFHFFKNNASPGVKLKINTPNLTAEQRERLIRKIENQYKGVERSQQLWILFDGMDAEPFGLSQKDMDFNEQQKWTADKIRGIFRVPKAILAQTDGVNYASAKEAKAIFVENVIKPKIERIIQQLNEFFVPQFANSEGLFLDYIDPNTESLELRLQKYANGLTNGWMTPNEVRREEGLDEIPVTGDVLYIPLNIQTISIKANKGIAVKNNRLQQLKTRSKGSIVDRDKIKNELVKQIKGLLLNQKKKSNNEVSHSVVFSKEQKEAFWKIKDSIFNTYFDKFKKEIDDIFVRQEKETKKKLNSKKDIKINPDSVLLDKNKEKKIADKILSPIVTLLMEESAKETFDFLNIDISLDVNGSDIQKYIKNRIFKFAGVSTDTTNEAIKTTLSEGIELGEGINDLSKRIADVFESARNYRSDRIARSEVTRFNVEATEQAYIESGVVEAKEWIVNPDACDMCLEFAGKTVKLGETFASKGDSVSSNDNEIILDYEDIEHPPLHPNCRCDIIAVLKSSKSINSEVEKQIIRLKKQAIESSNDLDLSIKEAENRINSSVSNTIQNQSDNIKNDITKKIDEVLEENE